MARSCPWSEHCRCQTWRKPLVLGTNCARPDAVAAMEAAGWEYPRTRLEFAVWSEVIPDRFCCHGIPHLEARAAWPDGDGYAPTRWFRSPVVGLTLREFMILAVEVGLHSPVKPDNIDPKTDLTKARLWWGVKEASHLMTGEARARLAVALLRQAAEKSGE